MVEYKNPRTSEQEILGIGRLVKSHAANEAEFALVVVDPHQGAGLGKQLLRRLVHVAREEKIARIIGHILPSNRAMLHISDKLGFRRLHSEGDALVRVELNPLHLPG